MSLIARMGRSSDLNIRKPVVRQRTKEEEKAALTMEGRPAIT
jgi:hypothetical protein